MGLGEVFGVVLVTLVIAEYYHWKYDRVQNERIRDLKGEEPDEIATRKHFNRPMPAIKRDMISQEKYDEMQKYGRTAGKIVGGNK